MTKIERQKLLKFIQTTINAHYQSQSPKINPNDLLKELNSYNYSHTILQKVSATHKSAITIEYEPSLLYTVLSFDVVLTMGNEFIKVTYKNTKINPSSKNEPNLIFTGVTQNYTSIISAI